MAPLAAIRLAGGTAAAPLVAIPPGDHAVGGAHGPLLPAFGRTRLEAADEREKPSPTLRLRVNSAIAMREPPDGGLWRRHIAVGDR